MCLMSVRRFEHAKTKRKLVNQNFTSFSLLDDVTIASLLHLARRNAPTCLQLYCGFDTRTISRVQRERIYVSTLKKFLEVCFLLSRKQVGFIHLLILKSVKLYIKVSRMGLILFFFHVFSVVPIFVLISCLQATTLIQNLFSMTKNQRVQ